MGAGIIIFFLDKCLKYIFFQLLKLKKNVVWGSRSGEVAPAYQVIKSLKIDYMWLYMLYPTPCLNGYRM